MSTLRRESATRKRDAEGRVICSCGCGRPPGKGRRTWHGQECVDRWMWANSPRFVRMKLEERDRGICALCGADAERARWRTERAASDWDWYRVHGLEARRRSFQRRNPKRFDVPDFLRSDRWCHWQPRVARAREARKAEMRRHGWPIHRRQSWWEADHIVPVVEGGGQCGAENYRTLCCRCHGSETAQLRKRLAEARRNENRKGTR
jgi:hypothetical protein